MITAKCINNINPYDNEPELDIEINKFYEDNKPLDIFKDE